jgi:plasmid stabilization system protein ParE
VISLHPEAVAEARAARAWYQERSASTAEAFLAELDHAVAMIGASPLRYPAHAHGTRRFVMRRFPFSVVYRVLDDDVLIVAVAHGRRRPGYWRARSSPPGEEA